MRIVSIVGARPQFIKAASLSQALRDAGHDERVLHTGQHYDRTMSQVFFDQLEIPEPHINLGVGSGSHGWQTGQMLTSIEGVLETQQPDWVVVFGDTNSTLAGALAACKLQIPVAHVEAGLRSFNREMPEEHNRVLTDHCSNLLLCPTQTAVRNLAAEGLTRGVRLVGDLMYDAALRFAALATEKSNVLDELSLKPKEYLLATVHRAYNTDKAEHLCDILAALIESGERVVFPVHPRTRLRIDELNGRIRHDRLQSRISLISPVGYLDMLVLERNARAILTDSGGIQKEAFFFGVPCITLRPETEWVETVEAGWNVVVGRDRSRIANALKRTDWPGNQPPNLFGNGDASERIVSCLEQGRV